MGIELNTKAPGVSQPVTGTPRIDFNVSGELKDLPSQSSKGLAPGEPGMIEWKDFESRPLTHDKLPFEIKK